MTMEQRQPRYLGESAAGPGYAMIAQRPFRYLEFPPPLVLVSNGAVSPDATLTRSTTATYWGL